MTQEYQLDSKTNQSISNSPYDRVRPEVRERFRYFLREHLRRACKDHDVQELGVTGLDINSPITLASLIDRVRKA